VVLGGYKDQSDAQINDLAQQGYTPELVNRGGVLRLVVQFDNRAAADQAWRALRGMFSSAYIRSLEEWCPGGITVSGNILQCEQ
jgi:hypothetical protein